MGRLVAESMQLTKQANRALEHLESLLRLASAQEHRAIITDYLCVVRRELVRASKQREGGRIRPAPRRT